MVDQAQMAARLSDKELDRATDSVIKYLAGEEQSPEAAKAARALLNTLPKEELDELKRLSQKATQGPPKLEPGVIYGIYIDYRKIAADQEEGRNGIRDKLRANSDNNPAVKEKLIELVEKTPQQPVPDAPPLRPGRLKLDDLLTRNEPLAIEQQQAYLKVLGYDVGKSGLDGKAGQGSMTQKALDEFAKKSGIDPKDTDAVQKALLKAVQNSPEANALAERTQKALQSGASAKPEDVKTLQWILKGNGAAMPNSLKGGRMDGIAGPETKTQLTLHLDKDRKPALADQPAPSDQPFYKKLKLFRDNSDDIIMGRGNAADLDPKLDQRLGSGVHGIELDTGEQGPTGRPSKLGQFQDAAREFGIDPSEVAEPDDGADSAPKTVRPAALTAKAPS